MKLVLTIDVSNDVLDVPTLLFALPSALDSVQRATSAGVGATGPDGMQVQVPGTGSIARVRFRREYHETVERLPAAPSLAASDTAGAQSEREGP